MKPETTLIARGRFYLGSMGVGMILTCLIGCFVPPTANMQSARCVDGKQYRIVPSVTAVEQQDGVTDQLHPEAILTLPVDKHLDINTAGKLILPLNGDLPRWYVLNLGLALSSDVDRWAVLPELGVAWSSAGAGDYLFTYGVSIAFYPRSGE